MSLIDIRVKPAGTGAEIDVGEITTFFARIGAIPEASGAMNAFFAVEKRNATVGIGRNGLAGTHFDTDLGPAFLALAGIHKNNMVRIPFCSLDFAT